MRNPLVCGLGPDYYTSLMPAINAPAWSVPNDGVESTTSDEQLETERAIHKLFAPLRKLQHNLVDADFDKDDSLVNPWLPSGEQASIAQPAKLVLDRQAHINFLVKLLEPLPAGYTAFDTNRSWLLYWVFHSFDLLATSLDPKGRARAIATLLSFQNLGTGGFGGGPNQVSHLMSTYAAVCALAIVGGPGTIPNPQDIDQGLSVEVGRGGWDEIDRPRMYTWMMSLKQPDGSFLVHNNGEVDVRASYCVICIAGMLGISTPELMRGMSDFIASCQTYEGGLAASSQPTYDHNLSSLPQLAAQDTSRPPLGEAHGGYAFCSLATHLALSLIPDCGSGSVQHGLPPTTCNPEDFKNMRCLDMDALIRWATQQQAIPIEGCGFRGRTNKLVDGCYGWFSGGGLFSVISAVLQHNLFQKDTAIDDFNGLLAAPLTPDLSAHTNSDATSDGSAASWTTVNSAQISPDAENEEDLSPLCLYDRQGLQQYILIAAQRPAAQGGGLRDKPGKRPDAYHTCYNLSGLSLAQNSVHLSPETQTFLTTHYRQKLASESQSPSSDEWNQQVYAALLSWTVSSRDELIVAQTEQDKATNKIQPVHPIFNITFPKAKAIMDWAYSQL